MLMPLLFLVDILAIVISGIAALVLRENLTITYVKISHALPYLVISTIVSFAIVPLSGVSRGLWRYFTFNDLIRIAFCAVAVVLTAAGLAFAYDRLDGVARAVPILHAILIVILLCVLRAAKRFRYLQRKRPKAPSLATATGHQPERVLLIGVNSVAELFMRAARELSSGQIQVAGLLSARNDYRGRKFHGESVLATPEELMEVLARLEVHGADIQRIVITVNPSQLSTGTMEALQTIELTSDITVDYFAERLNFNDNRSGNSIAKTTHTQVQMPSLQDMAQSVDISRAYWQVKRAFDFSVALFLIILTTPVMLLVATAVAIDVGLPVVFWQERLGMYGRRLRLNKFRTMRPAHDAKGMRIPDDRRSGSIGRFLRRSRLDELPQLFHILVGDMSFIGPRPLLFSEQRLDYTARLAIRPGLTGWAQVHGGRAVTLDDKVAMDLWYICHANFFLDAVIVLKTFRMIVVGDKPDESVITSARRGVDALVGRRSPRVH
ncbi:sugar transferase [Camelimonas fluminis]|uniref:Sugar transferase n=1 Tax=Camelimonas fluminis TaxID=1576911 RepID=A0ABV7UG58_9HYPH|nr:sugar transferase [Camelimonas fluminis]